MGSVNILFKLLRFETKQLDAKSLAALCIIYHLSTAYTRTID